MGIGRRGGSRRAGRRLPEVGPGRDGRARNRAKGARNGCDLSCAGCRLPDVGPGRDGRARNRAKGARNGCDSSWAGRRGVMDGPGIGRMGPATGATRVAPVAGCGGSVMDGPGQR